MKRLLLCLAAVLLMPVQTAWAASGETPRLDMDVRLDPDSRLLSAQASLEITADHLDFALLPSLKLALLRIDGRKLPTPSPDASGSVHLGLNGSGRHKIEFSYRGFLAPLQDLDQRQVLAHLPPMANPRGSFLPAGSGWYPDPGVPFSYRLRLQLPAGQKGLVPGTLVRESERHGYRAEFSFDHPAEGIDLMAGPYQVTERLIPRPGQPPLRLRTWFYADMADLAAGYLDDAARYIERYSKAIGPYPFDAFSIVAAPLPTGFGMPSLTYLGRDVLRLPFIRATSLGHEILHNWWGNGVYPDWATGNWSEGLTTFMADYAYKEDESPDAARAARLAWLRDLAAVPAAEDTPLTAFTARHHGISSIIGYDKAAMVFLMLRDEIGADAFAKGLRLFWQRHRFHSAGWTDLQHDFSEAAGRDLSLFFQQWVQRAGEPRLKLTQAHWSDGLLQLTLEQQGPVYRLRVPLHLRVYPDQTEVRWVQVRKPVTHIDLPAPRLVQAVDLDPDYRLWRRVEKDHFPPILREVFVAPRAGLLLADDTSTEVNSAAQSLAARVLEAPPAKLQASGPGLPGDSPVLIIGRTAQVAALLRRLGLPPAPSQVAAKGSARVWAGRDDSGRSYAVIAAEQADGLQAVARPLPHYGRESWLVFEHAKAVDKGIWPPRVERIRVEASLLAGQIPAFGVQ